MSQVFTCTNFTGFYPVGCAAVVVASSALEAADLLNVELRKRGLLGDAKAEDMRALPTALRLYVEVLNDGNY